MQYALTGLTGILILLGLTCYILSNLLREETTERKDLSDELQEAWSEVERLNEVILTIEYELQQEGIQVNYEGVIQ